MPRKPSRAAEVCREYCGEFPDEDNRTVARALHKQHPRLFASVEYARNHVRRVRGLMGQRNADYVADKSLFREPGKAGQVKLPEFIEQKWEPIQIDGPATIAVLSDLHVPYTTKSALETAVAYVKRYHKPDVVLLNGDIFDFHQGSRFEHEPDSLTMTEEIPMGVQLMIWLRQEFPKARMIFKEGNHDERWSRWLVQGGSMELARVAGLRLQGMLAKEIDRVYYKRDGEKTETLAPYGWQYITDRGWIKAGHLPIMHGHELGIKSSVSPGRAAFLKLSHSVMIGHLHQTNTFRKQNKVAGEQAAFTVGCLSGLTPFWNRTASFNHGFAVVEVGSDGEYNVHNYAISGGKVRAS